MGSVLHLTSIYNAYPLHSNVVSRQIATGRCLTNKEVAFVRTYAKKRRGVQINYYSTLQNYALKKGTNVIFFSEITESGAFMRLGNCSFLFHLNYNGGHEVFQIRFFYKKVTINT